MTLCVALGRGERRQWNVRVINKYNDATVWETDMDDKLKKAINNLLDMMWHDADCYREIPAALTEKMWKDADPSQYKAWKAVKNLMSK